MNDNETWTDRMYIILYVDEIKALRSLAKRERRSMREQAAYMIRQKLMELGELPAVDNEV